MVRKLGLLATLLNLSLSTGAFAQTYGGGSIAPPLVGDEVIHLEQGGQATTTIGSIAAFANRNGGACASDCTFSGHTTTSNLTVSSGINGIPPIFGVRDDSPATPASGGSGNAVGDVLTLQDGCNPTSAQIGVTQVSSGAVTQYDIVGRGSCLTPPSNPVSVLSTSGSGTGASFNLNWGWMSAGLTWGPNVTQNSANLFLQDLSSASGNNKYTGNESTFIGGFSGRGILSGNFITAIGWDACGVGGGGPITGAGAQICIGTDAGRNIVQGIVNGIILGTGSGENIGASTDVVIGNGIANALVSGMQNLCIMGCNTLVSGSLNTVGGFQADVNTVGAGSTVIWGANARGASFSTIVGANSGNSAMTGRATILGQNIGHTTCASGSGVILIGSGNEATAVDCPSSNSNSWMNIANAIIVGSVPVTITSGFGTSPTVANGFTSAAFQINVGTGGTASSGVVHLSNNNAPHGWACSAVDGTNAATSNTVATPLSQSSITLTNYSRTTGVLTAWAASDIITVTCDGF